jgi:hypothetical protein
MDTWQRRIAPEPQRIRLGEEHEVRYWCATFNTTKQELEHAVREAGSVAEDVLRYLDRRRVSS